MCVLSPTRVFVVLANFRILEPNVQPPLAFVAVLHCLLLKLPMRHSCLTMEICYGVWFSSESYFISHTHAQGTPSSSCGYQQLARAYVSRTCRHGSMFGEGVNRNPAVREVALRECYHGYKDMIWSQNPSCFVTSRVCRH